jgi:hypothetical protein
LFGKLEALGEEREEEEEDATEGEVMMDFLQMGHVICPCCCCCMMEWRQL